MKLIFIIVFILGAYATGAPTTQRPRFPFSSTTSTMKPDSSNSSQEDQPSLLDSLKKRLDHLDQPMLQSLDILLNEERGKQTARGILTRTLDLMDSREIAGSSRSRQYDDQAAAFGRLITGDQRFGNDTLDQFSDKQHVPSSDSSDEPYCEEVRIPGIARQVDVDVMRKIVEMHLNGMTEKQIQNRYRWYKRGYIQSFMKRLDPDFCTNQKMHEINKYVLQMIIEARSSLQPVHGRNLRNWALARANEVGAQSFKASPTWLYKFKKNHKIGSRKVTEYVDRDPTTDQDVIDTRIDEFLTEFERLEVFFPRRQIWNFDQSPFNYEISNERTLSWIGERDTRLRVGSLNKRTHSYTIQPLISRDGRAIGKLLICLQEKDGVFGPLVSQAVRGYEDRYGNVVILASCSGKMSKELISEWMRRVFYPALNSLRPEDTDTEISSSLEEMELGDRYLRFDEEERQRQETTSRACFAGQEERTKRFCSSTGRNCSLEESSRRQAVGHRRCWKKPHTLLIGDSWTGHSGPDNVQRSRELGAQLLIIPKKTTDQIQPLDVTVFRQYKKFFKRITEEAIFTNRLEYITSREGIVNTHSLVWNQFGSEAYSDMLLWAWRNTDPSWRQTELGDQQRPVPRMVQEIQFEFNRSTTCEARENGDTCGSRAFLKCSHCGKLLCIHHFLNRTCVHDVSSIRAGPSNSRPGSPVEQASDPDDGDDDMEPFDYRGWWSLRPTPDPNSSTRTSTTTSTTTTTTTTTASPDYIHDELFA